MTSPSSSLPASTSSSVEKRIKREPAVQQQVANMQQQQPAEERTRQQQEIPTIPTIPISTIQNPSSSKVHIKMEQIEQTEQGDGL